MIQLSDVDSITITALPSPPKVKTIDKKVEEHSISFIGNMVHIDNDWYKIYTNETKKMRELYNKLDYNEKSIIKFKI